MISGRTNLLKLHEAIAVVLLSMPERTGSYEEISAEIERRGLYYRPKDGEAPPPEQIKLRTYRTTKAGKTYSHLFRYVEPHKVQLSRGG